MPISPQRHGFLVGALVLGASLIAVPIHGSPHARAGACTHSLVPADAPRIPAIVLEAAPGSVFCFAAGVYHMTDVIRPSDGDRFVGTGSGRRGTVLSGAATITEWASTGGLYVHAGDVVKLPLGGECADGTETCRYPDWLFVDGRASERVLSPCTTANVTRGRFCIDYDANRMYLAEDPRGLRVEYSFVPQAIVGLVDKGVTVQNLRITKYANAAKEGAALVAGPSWLVKRVDINATHSCAISMPGSGFIVRRSHLHHNGQFGFCAGGGSANGLFADNEVDHNNTLGFGGTVGGGGGKFTGTRNLTITGNNVHDNNGTGIWLDADNRDAVVSGNRSSNNTDIYDGGDGIKIEVSCDVTVSDNTTSGNGRGGIHINNSQRILVGGSRSGNTVSVPPGGAFGIALHAGGRETGGDGLQCGPGSQASTIDNRVIANDITMPHRVAAWNGLRRGFGNAEVHGNRFSGNRYHVPACSAERWKWWDGETMVTVPFSGGGMSWQGFGQDPSPQGTCRS